MSSYLPLSSYQSPSIPYYVAQGASLNIGTQNNITVQYQDSTVQGVLTFDKNTAGTLTENMGVFTYNGGAGVGPLQSIGLQNNLVKWDNLTVGKLNVCGPVQAGTEVPSVLSADTSGNLLLQTIKPVAIRDNTGAVGTAGKVLSVSDASGHLLWATPGGGSTQIRAGTALLDAGSGTVGVTFSTPFSSSPVIVASYVGSSPAQPVIILSYNNTAFVASGQNNATFNWIATVSQ